MSSSRAGDAGGLDVDDPGAPLAVALGPVDPPADHDAAEVDAEGVLDGDDLAGLGPVVPGQELGDHLLGLAALLLGVPDAAEVQVVPDLVEPLGDVVVGRPVVAADQLGDRVDHLAHRGVLARRRRPRRRRTRPAASAARTSRTSPPARATARAARPRRTPVLRATGRSGRTSCRGSAPCTPLRASRARCPAADRRSGGAVPASVTTERRSATSARSDSHRVRSSSWACSAAPGSSSRRKREGRSSASSPPTAVTISRLRARVAAT